MIHSKHYCLCSFHVGSRCQTPSAYEVALRIAAELFVYAEQIGYHFSLLDMGGGFPGHQGSSEIFNQVSSAINTSLNTLFNSDTYSELQIIAEPGITIQFPCICMCIHIDYCRSILCHFHPHNSG